MDLFVTGWVEEHQVVQGIWATVDALDDVMAIPVSVFGQTLFTYWTRACLG